MSGWAHEPGSAPASRQQCTLLCSPTAYRPIGQQARCGQPQTLILAPRPFSLQRPLASVPPPPLLTPHVCSRLLPTYESSRFEVEWSAGRQVPRELSLQGMVELSRASSIRSGLSFLLPLDGAPLHVLANREISVVVRFVLGQPYLGECTGRRDADGGEVVWVSRDPNAPGGEVRLLPLGCYEKGEPCQARQTPRQDRNMKSG